MPIDQIGTAGIANGAVIPADLSTGGPSWDTSGVVSVGVGVKFPATQVPSADANTLDDYEEGTFTPSLSDGTTSVAMGLSSYIKIGRVVTVQIGAYNTNFSSLAAAGYLQITGLPFSASSSTAAGQWAPLATNSTATNPNIAGYFVGTTMILYFMNGVIDSTPITRNNLNGGSTTFTVRFGGVSYIAAA
jgi:hypothetical protein